MNRKMKRWMAGGILTIIVFGSIHLYSFGRVSGDGQAEQLDLGYKYLSDMDYEPESEAGWKT